MELLIMHFTPSSCFFPSLNSEYFSYQPCIRTSVDFRRFTSYFDSITVICMLRFKDYQATFDSLFLFVSYVTILYEIWFDSFEWYKGTVMCSGMKIPRQREAVFYFLLLQRTTEEN
jgi:hypothetical protein